MGWRRSGALRRRWWRSAVRAAALSSAVAALAAQVPGTGPANASPGPHLASGRPTAHRASGATAGSRALAELAAGEAIARHEAVARLRPGTGACQGLLQSRVATDAPCTHGPDAWLPNRDGHVGVPLGIRATSLPQFDDLPGIPCYTSGPRVHVFYAYFEKNLLDAAGSTNRRAAILNAVAVADRILNVSAGQSGGARHIRWVMRQCHLTITPFRVAPHWTFEAFDPTYLREHLERAGLMSRSEKGLTFLETATAPIPAGCQGVGELWPDDRNSSTNLNNHGDMNTLVVTGCADILFDRFAMGEIAIHELFHTMGAVQNSAPHHTNSSHCWDESDVMCYDDDGRPKTFPLKDICPTTVPELLDCRDNDYFDTSPAGGSYLATHWDTARNAFQATTPPARFQPLPVPRIALKSPGSVVSGAVTVPLIVRSPGGGITEVDFTVNGHRTVDRTAPYAITIDTLKRPNGTKLTVGAVAIDRFERRGTAKQIAFSVRNPVVKLKAPTSFESIGQWFDWSATATAGPGHTIQKVELLAAYDDGTSAVLATDGTAPFGGTVTSLPRPARFARTLRVRATQSGGTTVTSPARDVVLAAPLVSNVVGPTYGVGAQPVTFLAEAGASPGLSVTSTHIRVFNGFGGGQPVDEFDLRTPIAKHDPNAWFSATWPRPGGFQPEASRTYTLEWTATDSAHSVTQIPYPVQVQWLAATHSSAGITQPFDGSTVGGDDVTLAAEAHLNGASSFGGQLDVDFDATFPVDGSTTPAWTVPNDVDPDGWDTTQFGNGPHLLLAHLYTDEPSGEAPSFGTIVNVHNGDPTIVVTGPTAGGQVTGSVHLHAALSGLPVGWGTPMRVEFFANGTNADEDASPGGSAADGTWNTARFADGRVEIRAVASFFGGTGAQWELWSPPVVVTVAH